MKVGRTHVISLFSAGSGLLAGGVAGYLLCRHRLSREFEERLSEEIAAIKRHYRPGACQHETGAPYIGPADVHSDDQGSDLESEDDPEYDGESAVDDDDESATSDEDWGVGAESESQPEVSDGIRGDTSKPYDITLEQFTDPPDLGWQQITIKYYAGDKILVDEQDKPIPDIKRTVGNVREDTFGDKDSDQPGIKYVRNHKLQVDFEIIRDERAYIDAVLSYGLPNRTE
jgi:hypothetical protein